MRLRLASLSLLTWCVMLAAIPAAAQTIYNNGPINGNTDARQINGGNGHGIVSDTFTLTATSTITSLEFAEWLTPGDTNASVLAVVSSQPDGGTTFFSQTVNLTQSNCLLNEYGYDVCTSSGSVNWNLSAGTYWLNLQDAHVTGGNPAYWDENSGIGCTSPGCPSSAQENGLGTIVRSVLSVVVARRLCPAP